MNISYRTIIDLYGNTIEVTNFDAAILLAKLKEKSPLKHSPFKLVNGISQKIKGREDELTTAGEYWADVLAKLKNLKNGIEVTSVLACNKYGFKDYDILNHPLIYRAKVRHDIKKGDIFNVYYGESSKMGVEWDGDLLSSLIGSGSGLERKHRFKANRKKMAPWKYKSN